VPPHLRNLVKLFQSENTVYSCEEISWRFAERFVNDALLVMRWVAGSRAGIIMKKYVLAVLAAALASANADAAVTYSFVGRVTFAFSASDYVRSDMEITQFDAQTGGVSGVSFRLSCPEGGRLSPCDEFIVNYANIGAANYFTDLAFQTNGVYLDKANARNGTLTVSGSPTVVAAGVPEPATWAMMILGMGAIGFAMRRQRVATRVTYAA
jgi:hypothetical protein